MDKQQEWKLVLDFYRGGYSEGFDRDGCYEFQRGDYNLGRFKLADQTPYFNVGGLMYRDTKPPAP